MCSFAFWYASMNLVWFSETIRPAAAFKQTALEKSLSSPLKIYADKFENLLGDDAEFNANKIIEIFKGKDNDFSKAVCLNAAAGLIVAENHTKFIDAYQNAKEHILSGKTYEHLKNIQNG